MMASLTLLLPGLSLDSSVRGAACLGCTQATREFGFSRNAHTQVAQQPIPKIIYPTVHRQRLAPCPGASHNSRLANVGHLFDYVQLTQTVVPLCLFVQGIQQRLVLAAHVLDVTEPVVD